MNQDQTVTSAPSSRAPLGKRNKAGLTLIVRTPCPAEAHDDAPRPQQKSVRKRDIVTALVLSTLLTAVVGVIAAKQDAHPVTAPNESVRTRTGAHGFTLIEMAIVLVIIGLIIGGVLAGQSLIRAANIAKSVSQIQKWQTAVNTFYGKFGYLPGDVPNPGVFGLTSPDTTQWAGDGAIEDHYGPSGNLSRANGEVGVFWTQLSLDTGLIEGAYPPLMPGSSCIPGTTLPVLQVNTSGGVVVQTDGTGQNWYGTGVSNCASSMYTVNNSPMTGQNALAIDTKIDDGMPNSGWVQATRIYGGTGSAVTPSVNWDMSCVTDGSPNSGNALDATYEMASNNCNLRILVK